MALTVAVIVSAKYRAREKTCPALIEGVKASGDKVIGLASSDPARRRTGFPIYTGIVSDVAIFYGFDGSRYSLLKKAFDDYKAAGKKAIYVDLGYFNNKAIHGRYGYHRFAVNDRHPTAYFQNVKHSADRFKVHSRNIDPWNGRGRNILICGMSQKCAEFEGYRFEQWEREAIEKIQAVTDRPIIYRPKPRNKDERQYPPIEGVEYSDPSKVKIDAELKNSWAVVSHHSNAGMDALLAGVPCFQDEGVGLALGRSNLALIEQPICPDDGERRQFAYDVAYCQFNRTEMHNGTAWRHFKDEGLVP